MPARRVGAYSKGCLIALGILVLLISAFLFIRHRISAPLRAIEKEYSLTNTRFPFDVGTGEPLSRNQLEKYAAIRAQLLPHLEELVTEINRARAEKAKKGGGARLAFKAGREMLRIARELKTTHISLLNEHEMSLNEYRWIGRQAFAALYHDAKAKTPECPGAWDSLNQAFVQGAPRIAKYRKNPPDLVARLDLKDLNPPDPVLSLVKDFHSRLFEPHDMIYQEVAVLLQTKPNE